MVNVFELGLKGLHEWKNIERAVKLTQPVLDEYADHKEVVDEVMHLLDEVEKIKTKVLPIVAAYQQVDDELVPLMQHLNDVFFPHEKKKKEARELPTPASGYDVKWLQQSLVDLADKFDWPKNVRKNKFVDGDLGPNTKEVVKSFQRKQVDDNVPGWKEEDIDGWAGIKTCARIYNVLSET